VLSQKRHRVFRFAFVVLLDVARRRRAGPLDEPGDRERRPGSHRAGRRAEGAAGSARTRGRPAPSPCPRWSAPGATPPPRPSCPPPSRKGRSGPAAPSPGAAFASEIARESLAQKTAVGGSGRARHAATTVRNRRQPPRSRRMRPGPGRRRGGRAATVRTRLGAAPPRHPRTSPGFGSARARRARPRAHRPGDVRDAAVPEAPEVRERQPDGLRLVQPRPRRSWRAGAASGWAARPASPRRRRARRARSRGRGGGRRPHGHPGTPRRARGGRRAQRPGSAATSSLRHPPARSRRATAARRIRRRRAATGPAGCRCRRRGCG
jgi:hypothetical protein